MAEAIWGAGMARRRRPDRAPRAAIQIDEGSQVAGLGMTRRCALPAMVPARPPSLPLAPRCGNSAQSRIVAQQKVARVRGFGFKPGTVAGDKKPMADFVAE